MITKKELRWAMDKAISENTGYPCDEEYWYTLDKICEHDLPESRWKSYPENKPEEGIEYLVKNKWGAISITNYREKSFKRNTLKRSTFDIFSIVSFTEIPE